jgi:hypothetical protein
MSAMLSVWVFASVRGDPPFSESGRARGLQRAIGRQAVRARNGGRRLFSAAGIQKSESRLCTAKQNSRRPPSSAVLRPPSLKLGGAGPVRPPSGDRQKAAIGAADPEKGHHHGDRSRRP